MQVSAQYVREHLDDLLASGEPGEEIEIARNGMPLAKLIIMPVNQNLSLRTGKRILGAGRGELRVPSVEKWKAMDNELEELMLNGSMFPDEQK